MNLRDRQKVKSRVLNTVKYQREKQKKKLRILNGIPWRVGVCESQRKNQIGVVTKTSIGFYIYSRTTEV